MRRVRAHVFISGLVQGVFFRDSTRRVAEREGVVGWVRNLMDGRVEAVLEGDEAAVARVLDWCRQGPPGAVVEKVDVHWEQPTGEFREFVVRRTWSA